MSRLSKIEAKDWDAELQAMTQPDTATALEQGLMRFFAHVPPLAKGLVGFAGALKMHRALPDRLVELVRLRVAFHNQCRSCMAIRYKDGVKAGVTEDLVCSLEKPMEADNLTPAEIGTRMWPIRSSCWRVLQPSRCSRILTASQTAPTHWSPHQTAMMTKSVTTAAVEMRAPATKSKMAPYGWTRQTRT